MIRCLVVDDEAGAVEILSRYIEKTPGLKLVKSFRSALDALAFLRGHEVDLVFLDIDMPELNGLRLGEMINRRKIRLVYCTAYAEYAVAGYELEALDYLLKPIAFERFLKAVAKVPESAGWPADGRKQRQQDLLFQDGEWPLVKTGPGVLFIQWRRVRGPVLRGRQHAVFQPGRDDVLQPKDGHGLE